MTIYRRGNFHSIAGHTQGSLTLESICLQLHQAALIIFTVLKLAQGVSERNYPSYHDSNTRKARKIKIKRQQEGKIEGKVSIWEQLFTKIEEQLNYCLPKCSGLTYLQPWLLCFISLNAWLWMGRFAICLNNSFLFSMNWVAVLRAIKASFLPSSLSAGTLILQDHCTTSTQASVPSYDFIAFPSNLPTRGKPSWPRCRLYKHEPPLR